MLRFLSEGHEGPILGLGLSKGNVARLLEDEPIGFDLAELGLRHCFCLLAIPGSTVLAEGKAQLRENDHVVITLDPAQLEGVFEAPLILELPPGPHGIVRAIVVAGETEVHLLQLLREAELIDEGTTIEGVEAFVDALEAEPVSGLMVERRSAPVAPRHSLKERLLGSPIAWIGALVAFAGLLTALIHLAGG